MIFVFLVKPLFLKPAENSQDYSEELGTLLVAYLKEEQTLWKKKKKWNEERQKSIFLC